MPDWDIELTLTTGRGKVLTRLVTIEDVPQQGVAQVAGIEECLSWANEPGSPVPLAALAYWQQAKSQGAMPYEVLTELESKWNLTFTCKEHVEIPVVATPPEARLSSRPSPTVPQSRASNPVGLLDQLKQRYIEIIEERKRLDDEFEILSRLFGRPKRKYERKAKSTARTRRSVGRSRAKVARSIQRVQATMDGAGGVGNDPEGEMGKRGRTTRRMVRENNDGDRRDVVEATKSGEAVLPPL